MNNKIIVRIAEGLGNQLFMYANGYALAKKINYELLIDNESGYFKKKNIRSYQLNNFQLETKICDNKFKFNSSLKNLKRKILIKLDLFKSKKKFIIEKKDQNKKSQFEDLDFSKFSNFFFLEGHFESEKYFIECREELKNKIKLKNETYYQNNQYVNLIKNNPDIVSICIRQHRFSERISNKFKHSAIAKSNNFTKKTIDYVYRAIDLIENKYKNMQYLVWSNDFINLRNYFPSNKFIFVELTENKILTDFYLLLHCKNFIVGPTTFHWWPAWLNQTSKSLIFRPKDIIVSNNKHFWPDNWIPV